MIDLVIMIVSEGLVIGRVPVMENGLYHTTELGSASVEVLHRRVTTSAEGKDSGTVKGFIRRISDRHNASYYNHTVHSDQYPTMF